MIWAAYERLGIWLGANALSAALLERRRGTWHTKSQADLPLLHAMDDLSADDLAKALVKLVKQLPRSARRADMSVAIGLPDRYVEEEYFDFDVFPTNPTEAKTLVRHRMARELGTPPDAIAITIHTDDTSDQIRACRARAIDAAALKKIETALTASGLRPERIDVWSGYARQEAARLGFAHGSALWCDDFEWSLMCWADKGAQTFFEKGPCDADVSELASTVVRIAKTHAHRNGVTDSPLAVSAPDTMAREILDAAEYLGVTVGSFPDDNGPKGRAAQVAAWM